MEIVEEGKVVRRAFFGDRCKICSTKVAIIVGDNDDEIKSVKHNTERDTYDVKWECPLCENQQVIKNIHPCEYKEWKNLNANQRANLEERIRRRRPDLSQEWQDYLEFPFGKPKE